MMILLFLATTTPFFKNDGKYYDPKNKKDQPRRTGS